MAEAHGDSPEAVACQLLLTIAAEGVRLDRQRGGWSKDQILAIYRECLAPVNVSWGEPTAASDADSVELLSRRRYGREQG